MSEPLGETQSSSISPLSPGLRLGAVAVLAALVGVVVGGGAAYFLVRHFENNSGGSVVIRNVTSSGGSASLPTLLATVSPSLVEVVREPTAGQRVTSDDVSSGFVASSSGLVVTSEGAVAGASGVEVGLASGQLLPATIAAADPDTGVVVLQVSGATMPSPLGFASSAPATGDVAIAVSFPVGSGVNADVGTVSATGLTVTIPGQGSASATSIIDGVLRSDAPQPVGSSGGPLVNSSGNVIGVLTGDRMQPVDQGSGASASGFALDASAAETLVDTLGSTGSAPHPIGLVCQWLDPASAAALGTDPGALVVAVDAGSSAASAGLEVGDVITSVGGTSMATSSARTYPSLSDLLVGLGIPTTVALTVLRNGNSHQLSLTLPSP